MVQKTYLYQISPDLRFPRRGSPALHLVHAVRRLQLVLQRRAAHGLHRLRRRHDLLPTARHHHRHLRHHPHHTRQEEQEQQRR